MPTFDFPGKNHVYAHHLTVPYRPPIRDAARSVGPGGDDDNLIIHGDNLDALKALLPRHAGRVKCVYIDPPYNTGNEGWRYNDRVNGPLMREWLERNGEVAADDLERHDKWLCMMWPRLCLLKELLADDGAIFVSIDDNELHHLRMIMDEIFGEENFFAILTRRAMHTVRSSSKDFNVNADYILAYAKHKMWFAEERSRYIRHVSDKTSKYPYDDGDGRGRYKLDPIYARNYYAPYTYVFSNGLEWSPPSGSYPRYSKDSLRAMEADNRIDLTGKEPRAKRYLSEVQEGQPPDTVLNPDIVGFNSHGTTELREIFGKGGVFPQPKPVKLVKFLLDIMRSKDALVLDSFAGSGTTAQAVLALNKEDGGNRRFILVECEDYADAVTADRVRRVIAGVENARDPALRAGLGGSFSFCTLGPAVGLEAMLAGGPLPSWSALAAYLLHAASGFSAGPDKLEPLNDVGLFRTIGETDYYLLYKPDTAYLRSHDAALNSARSRRIEAISRKCGRRAVVFGPAAYLEQPDLTDRGILFCQLPYELSRAD